jgi:hypothetical protein
VGGVFLRRLLLSLDLKVNDFLLVDVSAIDLAGWNVPPVETVAREDGVDGAKLPRFNLFSLLLTA